MNKIKTNILRVVSDDPTDIYYRAIAELLMMLKQSKLKKRCSEIYFGYPLAGNLNVTKKSKSYKKSLKR